MRLIIHPADDNPTEAIAAIETTQRIEYEQPSYRVELAGPDQAVTPGVYVQALLVIHNLGEEEDRYFIEIDGVPPEWVRLERVETVLEPGERTNLTISFKPTRKSDSVPGDYPCVVLASTWAARVSTMGKRYRYTSITRATPRFN